MSRTENEYHIVAFDPGGTTGWAHLILDYRAFSRPDNKALRWLKHWECGEYTGPENSQVAEASRLIWRAKFGDMPFNSDVGVVSSGLTRADLLSENFELTQQIGGNNLLSPVRINAKLDWICSQWALKLNLQKRGLRLQQTAHRLNLMGFMSPFRKNGTWSSTGRGKDAFSAVQHAVTWLRRVKTESKSRPWKLGEGGVANVRWDCACSRGQRCDIRHPR